MAGSAAILLPVLLAVLAAALAPSSAAPQPSNVLVRSASARPCDPTDSTSCPANRVCAGPSGQEQCAMTLSEGKPCGGDPRWACRSDLTCASSVCKTPENGDCSNSQAVCADSTTCIPSFGGGAICRRRVGIAMLCGMTGPLRFPDCKEELVCANRACRLRRGARCDFPGALCEPDALCLGTRFVKYCYPGRTEGAFCSSIGFLRCASGMLCVSSRCNAGTVSLGDACDTEGGLICRNSWICAGLPGRRRCVMGRTRSQSCGGDELEVCREGLRCVRGQCRQY